jgi:hypothetical protein
MVLLKALDFFASTRRSVSEGENLMAEGGAPRKSPSPPEHDEPRNRHDGDS